MWGSSNNNSLAGFCGYSRLATAFKPAIHQQITSSVLKSITKSVNGRDLEFTDQSVTEVSNANKDVDCGGNSSCVCYSCQQDSSAHFDDENFTGGYGRLKTLRQSIIREITASSPNGAAGRRDLGMALHTLQDFYAHSNRVEAGLSAYDSMLGQSIFGGLSATTATCPVNSSTLGGAGLSSVTSGYFPDYSPAFRKCSHGFITCSGINKDDPSRPNYAAANGLAVTATKSFVNSILNDPAVTNNEKAIRALMGIKSTLGFVIDTTGSMTDIIAQVQAQVVATVNNVVGTTNEPDQYLLEPFNDPTWGPTFTTDDAGAFIAAVNALTASGGGDCPELAMHGLEDAIAASYPNSQLFLYTDASAKDGELAGGVVAAAQAKKIVGNFLNFGTCYSRMLKPSEPRSISGSGGIDPSFVQVANGTGGQAFFLQRNEAAKTFALIQPQLGVLPVTILTASGSLGAASQTFNVPIDGTVGTAIFVVSADFPQTMNIIDPSGNMVQATSPGVNFTNLSTGEVVTIASPVPGAWQLQLAGSGNFSVAVQGSTTTDQVDNLIRLDEFAFVTLTGRIGHSGYFQIPGQPASGVTQTGLAVLQGPIATANFELLSQAGTALQAITLAPGDPNAAPEELTGSFSIPPGPFRLGVTGTDAAGRPFQRVFPALFTPAPVRIAVNNTIDMLPPGVTTPLTYTVTNPGSSDTFTIVVTDNLGFVGAVSPSTLTLASGASSSIMVNVSVPTSAQTGTAVQITVTAMSATNPLAINTTVQSLEVSTSIVDTTPPVVTVSAKPTTLWPSNGQMVPVTISGTIADAASGVDLGSGSFAVSDEYGMVQPSGPVAISNDGSYSFSISLQSSRKGSDGDGRQYIIGVFAKDNAGNLGSASATVTVPHDQGN